MPENSAGFTSGPLEQHVDTQTTANSTVLESLSPLLGFFRTAADPFSTQALWRHTVGQQDIMTGVVLFAMPYMHHYKVQLDNGPVVAAIGLSSGPLMPFGATATDIFSPGSNILLLWPSNSQYPFIVGGAPYLCGDDKKNLAAVLQMGGNAEVVGQRGYRELPSQLVMDGQIQNYGCGRPLDSSSFEHSISTETGTSFLLDPYQIALSVNEGCGLFLNWFGNYAKLRGFSLDIESYSEHVHQRADEGENFSFRGGIVYPWEAAGQSEYGKEFTETRSPKDYQLDPEVPYGSIDLPGEPDNDLVPIYRYMEYGGYHGQGHLRMVSLPSAPFNGRHRNPAHDGSSGPDYGLFQESIALDGSYTVRSAKSLLFSKYCLIPSPRRSYDTEDTDGGSSARMQSNSRGAWDPAVGGKKKLMKNYAFSGVKPDCTGIDNPDTDCPAKHAVTGDLEIEKDSVPDSEHNLLKVVGVLDLLSYNYNWRIAHPFWYHHDYSGMQESDLVEAEDAKLDRATIKLQFDMLADRSYMAQPEASKLEIDHRYGDVDYFRTISYINMLDDGSVLIGDGYGAQIVMSGGQIRLEAPGEIMLQPGTRVVTLCDEFHVRAKSNIELSSSTKDVRIKAEVNMQLLSGNGGEGGMLIENKSDGRGHQYQDLIGDQVKDNGITILAKDSEIGVIGKDTYIRSGAGGSTGDIVLDTQGNGNLKTYSNAVHIFEETGVSIWESPNIGTTVEEEWRATHRFHRTESWVSSPFSARGDLSTTQGDLITDKNIYAGNNIAAGNQLAHYKGNYVGDLSQGDEGTNVADIVSKRNIKVEEGHSKLLGMGYDAFNGISERYYQKDQLGNNSFIKETIGFSFNDKSDNSYGYSSFVLLETRWQQWSRMRLAEGGKEWKEKFVKYQGAELYPWPGKENWVLKGAEQDGCWRAYAEHKYFDPVSGYGKIPYPPLVKAEMDVFLKEDGTKSGDFPAPDKNYLLIGGE
jgi:hypothetical protein